MSSLALVVLDMAGTLVDDGGAVLNAYRSALAGERIPFSEDDIQAARGGNKRAVFRTFALRAFGPGAEAAGAEARAFERFEELLDEEYRGGPLAPFPGVEDALALLRDRGLALASNTGFPRALQRLILERLGWLEGPFDAHVAGDEVAEGRPAPFMIHLAMQRTGVLSTGRVLVAGDTPLDLQAGCNAGAAGIVGVLTGTHGLATLGRVRHTHIIPSVADLPELIESEFNA